VDIFVSYASEQRSLAEEIVLALRAEGHRVFFDRAELTDGDTYNAPLREGIEACDLLVFLVSPESVQPGRYTLTEVGLAEKKWPAPAGHVLPVMVRPTETAAIPAYLRSVVMLRPAGSIPAEVVTAVDRLLKPRWQRWLRRYAVVLGLLAVAGGGFAAWQGVESWRACREASGLAEEARLLQGAGDYVAAWDRYAGALALCPRSGAASDGQARVAMDWLENIRVTQGKQTFSDIADQVQPALSRAAMSRDGRRAGDALAHLGWADFLRTRDGHGGLDPARYYRQALERDPKNPYAHAFWGHYILSTGGDAQAAKTHFAQALASPAERPFVRTLQLAALTWRSSPDLQDEVARAANEMRLQGETLEGASADSTRSAIWNAYYDRLVRGHDREDFLAAVPAQDHLATLQWLFPKYAESYSNRSVYLFMLAQLQEHAGSRSEALATYQSLLDLLAERGAVSGSLASGARKAVQRLQKR
jgi:tetratricopeptide (TPR) repeat protein